MADRGARSRLVMTTTMLGSQIIRAAAEGAHGPRENTREKFQRGKDLCKELYHAFEIAELQIAVEERGQMAAFLEHTIGQQK